MEEVSGLAKAGKILLLIGAILSVVGAGFLLIASIFLLSLGSIANGTDGNKEAGAFSVVGIVYIVLAIVIAVGSIFGFLAYGRAKRGDLHGAWVYGLVSALVPPLQVVPLIGAILCHVSPEGEAGKRR